MSKGFWQGLPKPFLILAPMEDVTDTVFRQVVASVAKPDVFFTEFTSTDGICSEGFEKVAQRLKFTPGERPIVAQIWGNKPEMFKKSAEILKEMGFDGVDINFGCPVKSIAAQKACSALIGEEGLVSEIIAATSEGAGDLPISVKTRIGQKKIITEDWIGFLLTKGVAAITVHGRTAAEMSKVPAHWDEIGKAVDLRNKGNYETLIIGNGDVVNAEHALELVRRFGVDGVMIGRGIFSNIAAFARKPVDLSPEQKLELLLKHGQLYEKTWGDQKSFWIMRKFVKAYVNGFARAGEVRARLMEEESWLGLKNRVLVEFGHVKKEL